MKTTAAEFGPGFTGPKTIVWAEEGEEGTGASAVDGKPQMALITFLPWWASGGCEGKWQC